MGNRARAKWGEKCGEGTAIAVPETESPSNTMSPWSRPTSVPSGILIHPTVWPQYTNDTEKQTGQTTVP